MLSISRKNVARAAGAAVGVVAAVAFLVAARPAARIAPLPASVKVTLAPPGTLAVTPAPPAPLLDATRLSPGGAHAVASFAVRNQSGITLRIGLRGTPDSHSLDGLVRVRITSGKTLVADTTLQGLRHGTTVTLPIRSGAERRLRLVAWIPGVVTSGYEGRIVNVSLALTTPTAGAAS